MFGGSLRAVNVIVCGYLTRLAGETAPKRNHFELLGQKWPCHPVRLPP